MIQRPKGNKSDYQRHLRAMYHGAFSDQRSVAYKIVQKYQGMRMLDMVDPSSITPQPMRMYLRAYCHKHEVFEVRHMGAETFKQIYLGLSHDIDSCIVQIDNPPELVVKGAFWLVDLHSVVTMHDPTDPDATHFADRLPMIGKYTPFQTLDAAIMAARTLRSKA